MVKSLWQFCERIPNFGFHWLLSSDVRPKWIKSVALLVFQAGLFGKPLSKCKQPVAQIWFPKIVSYICLPPVLTQVDALPVMLWTAPVIKDWLHPSVQRKNQKERGGWAHWLIFYWLLVVLASASLDVHLNKHMFLATATTDFWHPLSQCCMMLVDNCMRSLFCVRCHASIL